MRARPWAAYLIAAGASLLAFAVRLYSGDWLVGFPFLTFFVGIALSAFFGGAGPGLVALVSSALLANYFLFFQTAGTAAGRATYGALCAFVLAGGLIVFLFNRMHAAIDEENRTKAELERLNDELDRRVVERTEALIVANEERQVVEAQLRQTQKIESIGHLTGGIAHDFNNMLAVVMGSIEMARRRLAAKDEVKASVALEQAYEGARRAATLTARLLAFARRQPLQPEAIELNKVVAATSELLRRTLGETVHLETVLAAGLWRTYADRAQLETAIVNLAVNARDAMPGGGRVTIETGNAELDDRYVRRHPDAPAPGQYVSVAVTDTGHGMPRDVIERAFEPFFTTKPVGKGTGLGLSQVHGYVKQSAGHVRVYSEVGRGTSVTIYLPRFTGASADAVETGPPETDMPKATTSRPVLVVEDDPQVRSMAVEALRELGYTVVHASNGPDALAQLDRLGDVGLLFTDIVMPHMTGKELVHLARRQRPQLNVLYSTGYSRNAVVHNGVVDGGVHLLQKPYTFEQLARKVASVIASHDS